MSHLLRGLLAALILLAATLALAADVPVNLLSNGSFDKTTAIDKLAARSANELKGFTNGGSTVLGAAVPDGWSYQTHEGTPSIGLDTTVTHGKAVALKMVNGTPKTVGVLRLQDPIELKAKTRYLFSYYVKGANIVQDERKMGATGIIECRTKGAATDVKPIFAAWAQPLAGTFDWQRIEMAFTTGDEPAVITNCQVQLRQVAGTAWFTELSLVETKNLILNTGFEGWVPTPSGQRSPNLPDGMPIGWWGDKESPTQGEKKTATIARDAAVKHSGAYAVRITNELPTDICSLVFPPVAIHKNTSYTVRCWVKGEKIAGSTGVMVWASTGPEKAFWEHQVHLAKSPAPCKGDFDWMPFEFKLDAGADAELAKITVQLRNATGTLWVDDVELIPADAAPAK